MKKKNANVTKIFNIAQLHIRSFFKLVLLTLILKFLLFGHASWHRNLALFSKTGCILSISQRWSRGHKARGQGHKKNPRPRPRTAFPRTDTLEAKDRNARGQGQGARTQAQVLSKKKKKRSSQKFFWRFPQKKRFPKNFSSAPQNINNSKNTAVLEPRTGQFSTT